MQYRHDDAQDDGLVAVDVAAGGVAWSRISAADGGVLSSPSSLSASFSRRWPQPPTSDTALFAEVPSWGFASQLCVFSKVVTVSASENTIFSETG
jgi:hypothetical protein